MARNPGDSRPNKPKKATIAEMEEHIREMRRQEDALKNKIHRLEVTITGNPVLMAKERLRNHNLIAAGDDDDYPGRPMRTRWQSQRMNRARSKQAMTALFLVILFIAFVFWFYQQLRANGVI
ncbi:MAG: hypothetical protein V4726_07520 [Verrucomicrobiota bacterium]